MFQLFLKLDLLASRTSMADYFCEHLKFLFIAIIFEKSRYFLTLYIHFQAKNMHRNTRWVAEPNIGNVMHFPQLTPIHYRRCLVRRRGPIHN